MNPTEPAPVSLAPAPAPVPAPTPVPSPVPENKSSHNVLIFIVLATLLAAAVAAYFFYAKNPSLPQIQELKSTPSTPEAVKVFDSSSLMYQFNTFSFKYPESLNLEVEEADRIYLTREKLQPEDTFYEGVISQKKSFFEISDTADVYNIDVLKRFGATDVKEVKVGDKTVLKAVMQNKEDASVKSLSYTYLTPYTNKGSVFFSLTTGAGNFSEKDVAALESIVASYEVNPNRYEPERFPLFQSGFMEAESVIYDAFLKRPDMSAGLAAQRAYLEGLKSGLANLTTKMIHVNEGESPLAFSFVEAWRNVQSAIALQVKDLRDSTQLSATIAPDRIKQALDRRAQTLAKIDGSSVKSFADIKIGTGDAASYGDIAAVNILGAEYKGRKYSGQEFANVEVLIGSPLDYMNGIAGYESYVLGLVGMKIGGTRAITFKSPSGYYITSTDIVEKGTEITYIVELLSIKKGTKEDIVKLIHQSPAFRTVSK